MIGFEPAVDGNPEACKRTHSLNCYYSEGRFGRGPMILGEEELDWMADAIKGAPGIRDMVQRMAGR